MRSIKEEALDRLILLGDAALRYAQLNTWPIIIANAIIKVSIPS